MTFLIRFMYNQFSNNNNLYSLLGQSVVLSLLIQVMKEAEVKNFKKPEPLDVRIDKASDTVNDEQGEQVDGNVVSCVKGERSASPSYSPTPAPLSNFSPFCAADQMRCSVHCHVRAVKQLVCL